MNLDDDALEKAIDATRSLLIRAPDYCDFEAVIRRAISVYLDEAPFLNRPRPVLTS